MEVLDTQIEESFTLGKKQLNVLADTLAGVPAIDIGSVEPLTRQYVADQLAGFTYSDTFTNSGGTNTHRPVVVGEILGKQARKVGYIDGLAKGDLVPLVAATTEACSSQKRPLVFRMVYGATEQASLRALSYPMPALQAMGRIREKADIPMFMQVIFANNISGNLNGLEPGLVTEESVAIQAGVTQIAHQMGLAERIGFYDDSLIDFDAIESTARTFEGAAPNDLLDLFRDKGAHNDSDSAYRYTAAHYVLHDSLDSRFQHIAGADMPDEAQVVEFGGVQEKYFKAARRLIAAALGTKVQIPQVYTRHRVPPYYMARGGDIAMRAYLTGSQVTSEITPVAQADLAYLRQFIDLVQLREEVCGV